MAVLIAGIASYGGWLVLRQIPAALGRREERARAARPMSDQVALSYEILDFGETGYLLRILGFPISFTFEVRLQSADELLAGKPGPVVWRSRGVQPSHINWSGRDTLH